MSISEFKKLHFVAHRWAQGARLGEQVAGSFALVSFEACDPAPADRVPVLLSNAPLQQFGLYFRAGRPARRRAPLRRADAVDRAPGAPRLPAEGGG